MYKNVLKNKDLKIKLNNFSSIKVNWLRKSKNILDISKELNIGLDSLVFIDDSKFEQEEVKKKFTRCRSTTSFKCK